MVFSNTKSLLIVTAALELGAGVSLLVAPSLTAEILLGAGLGSRESAFVGNVAGAALVSIGVSCWMERNSDRGGPPVGLVAGLAVYNAAVTALLIYATVIDDMHGVGLWPACGLHLALLIWCAARLPEGRGVDPQPR